MFCLFVFVALSSSLFYGLTFRWCGSGQGTCAEDAVQLRVITMPCVYSSLFVFTSVFECGSSVGRACFILNNDQEVV